MEKALGLPEGFLEKNAMMRIDVHSPKELKLRIPSGNEAGVNPQWIPAGKLPQGGSEAIVDVGEIPVSRYIVKSIGGKR